MNDEALKKELAKIIRESNDDLIKSIIDLVKSAFAMGIPTEEIILGLESMRDQLNKPKP